MKHIFVFYPLKFTLVPSMVVSSVLLNDGVKIGKGGGAGHICSSIDDLKRNYSYSY